MNGYLGDPMGNCIFYDGCNPSEAAYRAFVVAHRRTEAADLLALASQMNTQAGGIVHLRQGEDVRLLDDYLPPEERKKSHRITCAYCGRTFIRPDKGICETCGAVLR